VKPLTKTTTYFLCPACNKHEFTIDHLEEIKNQNSFAWACDCGKRIHFTYVSKDEINIERIENHFEPVLNLLEYCNDSRLKLLIKGRQFLDKDGKDTGNQEYFYNEHTCPSNITQDVVKVILENDTDPHGTFQYVGTIRLPNAWSDESVEIVENEINGINDANGIVPKLTSTTEIRTIL
jgi:hypothetical protein